MIYLIFFVFLFTITQGLIPSVKKASAVIAVALWLIMGLRDYTVGEDTLGYVMDFNYMRDQSFSNLLHIVETKNEPLFAFLMGMVAQLTDLYTIMLLFWALFPVFAIHSVLKKNIEIPSELAISYILFFLLGLFVFFTAGLRQTVAISLSFLSYNYLKKPYGRFFYMQRNFWAFGVCMIAGFFIHNTILIFAIMYPIIPLLKKFRLKWWHLVPIGLVFVYLSRMDMSQIMLVTQFFLADRFDGYGENNFESSWSPSAFIMQLALFLFCFMMRKRLEKRNEENVLLLNFVLIGLFFQSMAGMLAEFARISYYFSIYFMILFPRALSEFSRRGKYSIVEVGFLSLSLIYLFFVSSANLPDYKFAFL